MMVFHHPVLGKLTRRRQRAGKLAGPAASGHTGEGPPGLACPVLGSCGGSTAARLLPLFSSGSTRAQASQGPLHTQDGWSWQRAAVGTEESCIRWSCGSQGRGSPGDFPGVSVHDPQSRPGHRPLNSGSLLLPGFSHQQQPPAP